MSYRNDSSPEEAILHGNFSRESSHFEDYDTYLFK